MFPIRRQWSFQPPVPTGLGDSALARSLVMLAAPTQPGRDFTGVHSLVPSGAPLAAGPGGLGWNLTGGSGQIVVPDADCLDLTTEFTVFGVVRSTDATGAQYILNKNYDGSSSVPMSLCVGGNATINGTAFFGGGIWRASGVTTDIRGDGKVHVIVGTFNNVADLTYYVDGKADATTNAAGFPTATTTDLYIGRYQSDAVSFRGEIYLAGVARRCWTAAEVLEFSRNPWALFEPRTIWVPVTAGAGGGPVSVNLTGQAVTATAGALAVGHAQPLAGTAGTASAGTFTPATSRALAGSAATASAGTLAPSSAVPLAGSAATGAQGTFTASSGGNVSVSLTGQAATGSAGTLGVARDTAIGGAALTSAAGTLTLGIAVPLSGAQLTSAQGSFTATAGGDKFVALTGQSMTTAQESFTASGGNSAAAGGYDDDKPKKRRFVVKVGDKLVAFNDATKALNSLKDEPDEPEAVEPAKVAKPKAPKPEAKPEVEVSIADIQAQAALYEQQQRVQEMARQQQYEQMLTLYESLKRQQDEEEVELLLMAL